MKKLALVFFISVSGLASELSFLVYDNKKDKIESVVVDKKSYKRLLKKTLQKSLRKEPKSDLKQEWLVLGIGGDAKAGFAGWSLGSGLAMEFHLRRVK